MLQKAAGPHAIKSVKTEKQSPFQPVWTAHVIGGRTLGPWERFISEIVIERSQDLRNLGRDHQ